MSLPSSPKLKKKIILLPLKLSNKRLTVTFISILLEKENFRDFERLFTKFTFKLAKWLCISYLKNYSTIQK